MSTVALVHHHVADFDAWKAVYDGFHDVQRERGVRHHHVWRPKDDASMVVVVHTFDSDEAARAFFDAPELRETMAQAGVDPSSVQIQFLDEAAGGAL